MWLIIKIKCPIGRAVATNNTLNYLLSASSQIVISWIFAFYEEVMTEREFSHEFLQLGVIFKLFNSCPVRINLLGMK